MTGLVTIDPATRYNGLGQFVIMLLIQVGGLGYMALFTAGMLLVGRRISMRDRLALQEATEQPGLTGLIGFLASIVKFTLLVEGTGFVLMAFHTVPELGWAMGLWIAAFHAVSAFNNAGFSLFSEGAVHWQHQAGPLLTLALLVIVGGLGFTVNRELVGQFVFRRPPQRRWQLLMTVVLVLTGFLLVSGTALFWLFEHANPRTLATLPWHEQLTNAFFMAVQPRTAGFNSVDMSALSVPTLLTTIVFMFVGAGPGGTAGGIKLTTVAVLFAGAVSSLQGQEDVTFPGLKRRIGDKVLRKAMTVLMFSIVAVLMPTWLLTMLEPHDFMRLLFECTSAFATVGLSTGITSQLTDASKLILIATMLIGRVGVLALLMAIFFRRRTTNLRYPEEPLIVG